jgi:alpha,alpha-trehalose-phosphate synthase [UDP-forming]
VVVANRLPVRRIDGQWVTSPGGLVSALVPILQEGEGSWVGWTGSPDDAPEPFVHDGIAQHPVELTAADVEVYYLGFCNGTVWPLYHDAIRTPEFHRHWWRPYRAVNRRFAEAAAAAAPRGGAVWVHDYQLQLVPAMLRELRPDLTIGFFLHIPFPPVEIFARLPWRRQVIDGLLGADVVGFQSGLARNNFARAAQRFTTVSGGSRALEYQGRQVVLDRAPISIDVARYAGLAASENVRETARVLRKELGEPGRVVLGVDRLDYTKGIDVRLRAFEAMLETYPELVGDAVFVQISVPSREGIGDYAEMRDRVEGLVGRINGAFGTPGRSPVHYQYRNLPMEELVAYYLVADVLTVTSLRDGMNLVAKEWVACRLDDTGVLLLSEFAGAAGEFRQALLVNPYDVDGMAAALHRAVVRPVEEQRRGMRSMRRYVQRHDVFAWARHCLDLIGA